MGEVATKFTSDSKQIERAYDTLYRQNVRLQQKVSEGGRKSRRQHNVVMGQVSREIGSLKSLAVGYLSVSTAIGTLTGGYREWEARLAAIGQETRKINEDLVKQLTLTGQTQHAARIEQTLATIPGVRREAANAAFGGVVGGVSARPEMLADIDRLLALTAASAPAADLGIDQATFSRFVGKLATVDTTRSPADVVDVAMAVNQMLGPSAGQFQSGEMFGAVRGFAQFMPPDQAMAIGIQAAAQNVPGLPRQLFDASQKVFEAPDTKGRKTLTAAEAAQRALAAANTPAERLRLIMGDQAVADFAIGTGNAGRLKLLDAGERGRIVEDLGASRGAMARTQADLLESRSGRDVAAVRQREKDAQATELRFGLSTREEEMQSARQILERRMFEEGLGAISQFVNQKYFSTNVAISELLGTSGQLGSGQTALTGTLARLDQQALQEFIAERNTVEGYQKFGPEGRLTDEAVRRQTGVMEEVRDELKAQGDERRSERRGGATVPRVNER